MLVHFFKYHGAGNDFILIDARSSHENILSSKAIESICRRRFGVGADGLMLLRSCEEYDFEMIYYNSDGLPGTMCGNGGRCITAFAKHLGLIKDKTTFLASDGPHHATVEETGLIKLKMIDVPNIIEENEYSFVNTGSPHYIKFVENPDDIDIVAEGRKIRNSGTFKKEGTNVNFVSQTGKILYIRTYERGVEDETFACGTGSVASAIAFYSRNKSLGTNIKVKTLGGNLEISFKAENGNYTDVYLKGPAVKVFEGDFEI